MSAHKRISSRDVAREAGVSQATVSYVLNNTEGVKIKPETREAVIQAAKKLNYYTNHMARGMRLKKSMSIGVVSDKNMSSHVFMNVLEGIRAYLEKSSYSITLCTNNTRNGDVRPADYIRYYNSNIIDGIIFAYANLSEEEHACLLENDIPFVSINAHVNESARYQVKTNIWKAISQAVQCLYDGGIRQIAYIGTEFLWEKNMKRYKGFLHACHERDLPVDEALVFRISTGEEGYEAALEAYFDRLGFVPRAILTDTVNVGFYVLRVASKRKIRIPDELSVVSIGVSQFARRAYPALSAIEAPLYEMGVKGCELLFGRLDNPSGYCAEPAEEVIILDWEFLKRESC